MIEKKAYKIYYRVLLSRYGVYNMSACGGAGCGREPLRSASVRRGSPQSSHDNTGVRQFLSSLKLTAEESAIARRIMMS